MSSNEFNEREKNKASINKLEADIKKEYNWLLKNVSHPDFLKRTRVYNGLIVLRDAKEDSQKRLRGMFPSIVSQYELKTTII